MDPEEDVETPCHAAYSSECDYLRVPKSSAVIRQLHVGKVFFLGDRCIIIPPHASFLCFLFLGGCIIPPHTSFLCFILGWVSFLF